MAGLHSIFLRSGCFCNPGACAYHLGLRASQLKQNYEAGHVCWDDNDIIDGRSASLCVNCVFVHYKNDNGNDIYNESVNVNVNVNVNINVSIDGRSSSLYVHGVDITMVQSNNFKTSSSNEGIVKGQRRRRIVQGCSNINLYDVKC